MSDLRFDDVVETNRMIGPAGKYAVSICKTCSERYKAVPDDFEHPTHTRLKQTGDSRDSTKFVPDGVDQDFLVYVTSMRAWNCCKSGEKPLDGFPEQPPEPSGFSFE